MANVTFSSSWNLSAFRSGINEMKAEVERFNLTFRKGVESGGGFFGSIDKAVGKAATGRFAGSMAALGAGMVVIKSIVGGLEKHWENIAAATERSRQNLDAMAATRAAVSGEKYSGESANAAAARSLADARAELASAQAEVDRIGDPTEAEGRAQFAREMSGTGLRGFIDWLRLSGSQYIPGMDAPINEASAEYNRRLDRVAAARQAVAKAEALQPYTEYANRTAQRSAQAGVISAEDRIGVAQGRTTGYEAAANAFIMAHQQYRDALAVYKNENDPRVLQAKAASLSAFSAYDSELTTARRYRNDPTISADSLARIGGGGGVNVFGNGRGELVFSQDRLTKSIDALTPAIRELGQILSRTSSTGGRGNDITR